MRSHPIVVSINTSATIFPARFATELFAAFELQLAFVLFKKRHQGIRGRKQTLPLFVIEGHGKTAKAVDADSTFFADLEFDTAASFRTHLFLKFGNTGD